MSKSLKKLIDINRLREFKNKLVGTGSAYVQTGAVDQTVGGTKTFSKPIAGSVTGSSGSCTGNAATATRANSAANADTATNATNSNAANQLQAFVNDDFTSGNHYVKAIRSSYGWSTHLWMCYNNGAKMADEVSVNYANSAGSANTANSATTATTATNATYANWLRTSSHSDHLFHTEWDGAYFWTYVTTGGGEYRAVRVARSDSSGYADTATRATQDSDGNQINTTYSKNGHTHDDRYYTETEVNNLLNGKANNSEVVHKSGDETIAGTKTFSNGVLVTSANALMAQNGEYTLVLRNDDTNTYLLMSDKGGVPGTWSSARPLTISNSTGVCDINGNASTATKATQDSDGNQINTTYSRVGHTHDDRYIPISASCNKNWHWEGRVSQPSWLWGSEDGINMYVYKPSDFKVNYANSANSAVTAYNGVDSSGSNWIRFINGIQICWAQILCGTSGASTWTYGASFSSAPVVTVCDYGGNNNAVFLTRAGNIGTTSCVIVMLDENRGSHASGEAQCIAIGRWK